ncbi:MAG: DUF4214 domain-containing protein [Actinomycetota bacterium]|nr:DUF4214 domain-containing protein [Actinomycetota bacterium]
MLAVFLGVMFTAPAAIHAQEIVSLEVTPEPGEIPALGQTIQYTATAIYDDDSEVDVTDTATWDIFDAGIATNDSGGQFTGVSSGSTYVTAKFGGLTNGAELFVNQGTMGLGLGSPDETTYFTLYATACNGLPWELVVTDDDSSVKVLTASGTIPSDEWWGHEVSTTLSAGDYTAIFSIDEITQDTRNFSIWGFESSFDISVGYAGETTTFTLNATNSSGKTADFLLVDDDTGSLVYYDDSIPVDSDDWSSTIDQTLEAGNYWAGFRIEDYWAGGYDFSVVARGKPKSPVEEKSAPKEHKPAGPAINEKPLSSYENTNSGFTTLFYNRLLLRAPEQEGLDAWIAGLESGAITGADVVERFIFGEECQTRISDYTNEEFITFLYKALFNREPGTDGYNAWLTRMSAGMTKEEVVDRFVHGEEFVNLCNTFGITPYEGYVDTSE